MLTQTPRVSHSVLVTQIRTSSVGMEALLTPEAKEVLRQFGEALDHDRAVRVRNRGFVSFDNANPAIEVQETDDEQRQGPPGPAARSRQGSARRQGAAGRPRKARPGSRVRSLRAAYEKQLGELEKAYPTLRHFADDDGMWLLVQSSVLDGLNAEATFLAAVSYHPNVGARSWAFWKMPTGYRWIGDRHTNFFDGSICAFSPAEDDAWSEGCSLVTLIDLYTVWAMRHLHLEIEGRWPGKHYALLNLLGLPDPYYRLTQVKESELCTCGIHGARYGECCRPSDLKHDFTKVKVDFERRNLGRSIGDRAPPRAVVDFIEGRRSVPPMREVHEPLREALASQRNTTIS